MTPQLPRRLVLTFTREGVEVRTLYRTKGGPRPGTAARKREAAELARAGLTEALRALEGPVESVGEAGFEMREDSLFLSGASNNAKQGEARRGG
jgi:hypothetical protein